MLEKEYQYYLDHKPEFLEKYLGKCIVIKNDSVIGVYDTQPQALEQTLKTEKLGTFLAHVVREDEVVHRFHSRVYVKEISPCL